jgi:hypothetical protein
MRPCWHLRLLFARSFELSLVDLPRSARACAMHWLGVASVLKGLLALSAVTPFAMVAHGVA